MLIDDRMKNLAKLMDVSVLRSQVHASNLANQNTPGYVARKVTFEDAFAQAVSRGDNDRARAIQAKIVEDPSGTFDNDGNNVSSQEEAGMLAQNRILYETYIAAMRGKNRLLDTAMRSPGV
jgi:flagellar basal-body rod protein FlgB